MRSLILLIAIAALAYVGFTNRSVVDQIMSGVNLLSAVDADSFAGKKLEPFALPTGHSKASFPGVPHIPHFGQELFSNIVYPGTAYVLADKELTYYLGEFAMPAVLPQFNSVNSTSSNLRPDLSTVLNNDVALSNNRQSNPVSAQSSVERCCQDWSQSQKATVESKYPVSLGGGRFNGLEIAGHMSDPAKRFRLRLFGDYNHQRMTVIAAIGKAGRVNDSGTSRFIDSLQMWQ
jgi:hypothetical protein